MKIKLIVFLVLLSNCILVIIGCKSDVQKEESKMSGEEKLVPLFYPIGGVYKGSVKVSIIPNSKKSKIYYTIDGSIPTENSILYKSQILIKETTVIRAMEIDEDRKSYNISGFEIVNNKKNPDIKSHYKSPINNWQDEIIYMLMIDRFNDVDKKTNNLGYGEYGNVEELYNGGDFKGIEEKLDYIKNLGVTAIWITPPVKNQYYDGNHAGYHGYWASSFIETDPHYGSIEDYKRLVDIAHSKGIRVIQDIVVNHIGDFFRISQTGRYEDVSSRWSINEKSLPLKEPDDIIWKMNNPNNLTKDEYLNSSFYNWTPMITDYNNINQIKNFQLGDLDDLNTKNPVVQSLLRGYFRYWIDKVGIDGYRVDTVYYVEPEFFEDFVNSEEQNNKGVRTYAKEAGKDDFIVFGEAWHRDDKVCARYTQDKNGKKRMDSLIYFPLNLAIRDIAVGEKTSLVSEVLNNRYKIGYANPDKLVTFIDNHDMERLLNKASSNMVKASYMIIMTIPGIPQLYYGGEQGMKVTRGTMFKNGFKDFGAINEKDNFQEHGEWWDFFKNIIQLRKSYKVFRYNDLKIVKDSDNGSGIFSYKITEKDSSGKIIKGIDKEALVIINTSKELKILYSQSYFDAGDKLEKLNPSVNFDKIDTILIGDNGYINIIVPPESSSVFILKEKNKNFDKSIYSLSIDSKFDKPLYRSIKLNGTMKYYKFPATIDLYIDDNYNKPIKSFQINSENWESEVEINNLSNGLRYIRGKIQGTNIYSNSIPFSYQRPYEPVLSVTDKKDDDYGPKGKKYISPTDVTFQGGFQDILGINILTSGGDLKIELTMKNISRVWKPTVNQFDHVMFSVFLQKPESSTGVNFQPLHNYQLPENFKWDYMFKLEGWSSVAFSSVSAEKDKNGTPISPVPTTLVNWDNEKQSVKENGVITITISSNTIGNPVTLKGWKLYINTWDIDMGKLRQIFIEPRQYSFGGGIMEKDPLIIDETNIITIP